MKKLITAFLLLLFAVWLGFLIHRDPGYILITYHTWSIETSLWIGIVCLLILFLLFYILLRLFRHTARLGINLQLWNKERRERKAGELTNKAFDALVEMQWNKAENLFSKSAKDSTCSVINYSAAAYAAEQVSALDRRNKYLFNLGKQTESSDKIAKLIESNFYLRSKQWKEALTILRMLQQKYPQDPAVIHTLIKGLKGIEDWQSLKNLLPLIAKKMESTQYKKLESHVYEKLLKKAIHPEWLEEVWEEIPKAQRTNTLIAKTYAMKAIELRRDNDAVNVIENALKKNWDGMLITYYGKLKSDRTSKLISHAESWLKKHPDDPNLLLCLGRLCLKEQLWGKARDYLNNALDIAATPEAYYELGQLFEATNDSRSALINYRKAFILLI